MNLHVEGRVNEINQEKRNKEVEISLHFSQRNRIHRHYNRLSDIKNS